MSHHMDERNTPELNSLLEAHHLATDKPSQLSDAFRLGYWASQAEIALLQAELTEARESLRLAVKSADLADASIDTAHNAAIEAAAQDVADWGELYASRNGGPMMQEILHDIRALNRP